MRITNKHNLSPVIVEAFKIISDEYDPAGQISVTELCGSPRIAALKRRYWSRIEEDVADRAWLVFGTAVHNIIARGGESLGYICEERLVIDYDGVKISMKPDLLSPDGVLSDFKVTSVYSWKSGGREEWKYQLNIYKWGLEQSGYRVTRLENILFLKDWRETEAVREDYPSAPIVSLPVEVLSDDEIKAYMEQRIALHKAAWEGHLPDCTDDDRWAEPAKYAVKKVGNKRAISGGVFTDLELAKEFAEQQRAKGNKVEIEHRPGANKRCERNKCRVADWCDQYQRIKGEENV